MLPVMETVIEGPLTEEAMDNAVQGVREVGIPHAVVYLDAADDKWRRRVWMRRRFENPDYDPVSVHDYDDDVVPVGGVIHSLYDAKRALRIAEIDSRYTTDIVDNIRDFAKHRLSDHDRDWIDDPARDYNHLLLRCDRLAGSTLRSLFSSPEDT